MQQGKVEVQFCINFTQAEIAICQFSRPNYSMPQIQLKPSEHIKIPYTSIKKCLPQRLCSVLTIKRHKSKHPIVSINLGSHILLHPQVHAEELQQFW